MQTSHLSRRALLSGAAASLALPWLPRDSHAARTCPNVSEKAWGELDKIGLLRPNDPRFVRLTQPENLRYYNPPAGPGLPPDPDAPCGVVRPRTADEVAYAINWARNNDLPMVPRSGGHSYAGCSTVPGLVINSSAMQSVKFEDGLVVAEGGALFGNLLASLRDIKADGDGRYTITHGRCRGVGLSAYLMGGGWALDSPHAGMGCDLVQKVEIVLADGQIVQATPESDIAQGGLFWAVRGGGGGNLGFATKWWLKPLTVRDVTVFTGSWRLTVGNAHDVYRTLLRALDAAPDSMGAEMTISTTAGTIKSPWRYELKLSCQLHGTKDEFKSILGAALAAADSAEAQNCCSSNNLLVTLPYWDAQDFFEIEAIPNRYQETSLFAGEVSDTFFATMFDILPTWSATASAARMTAYRVGGKVNKVAPADTAFVHRTSRWIVTTDIDWSGGASQQVIDDNLEWQRYLQKSLSTILGNPGSYYNFPDPGLENPAQAYWGGNLERLSRIKQHYDPNLVFTPPRNQGIPLPP
jgi:FAD/FMN-containing dehydrogenase